MSQRTRVFISYSHKNAKYLERLQVHLAQYGRTSDAEYWDDTKIQAGADWECEIAEAIDSARVAILLVSPDFLTSSFITEKELPRLLSAARSEGVVILPVIVSSCAFNASVLKGYQLVNTPDHPLNAMSVPQREKVWNKVAALAARTLELDASHADEALASDAGADSVQPSSSSSKPQPHLSSSTGLRRPETSVATPAATSANDRAQEPELTPRSIILCDDDEGVREGMFYLLREDFPDLLVVQATTGRQALRLLDNEAPALVILDVRMPDIDGFTVLEELAARAVRFPIILMSGDSWVQDKVFTRMERWIPSLIPGQVRTMNKPWDLDVFTALLRELLPERVP